MLKKVKNEAEYNNKVEITFTDGHSKEVEYEEIQDLELKD